MPKVNYAITIAIDDKHSVFHFYTMYENDKTFENEQAEENNKYKITHTIKSYSSKELNDDFFEKFKNVVKQFVEDNPSEDVKKITVIVPDNAYLMDTIKIPTMKGFGQTRKTLDNNLRGLYKNFNDLKVNAIIKNQNKQYTTYITTLLLKNIVSSIYSSCSENKLLVDTLTYSSSTLVSGAVTINPKLKNGSYMLLDIKDIYSRYVFVINGKVVGSYTIPFGMESLTKKRVLKEDMLFDHLTAEIMVINAKEKARAKKLTVMAMDAVFEDESLDEIEGEEENQTEEKTLDNVKTYVKKARKLPKFMLRETPTTPEGVMCENFRIFVKWALTLLESNKKITEQVEINNIYVNIPTNLQYILDKTNEEMENEIRFFPLTTPEDNIEESILNNLELYGSIFPKQVNISGKL